MKNNKHPHHDLIAEWIKDTSKEVQIKTKSNTFICRSIKEVIGDKKGVCEFRIKPRELIKWHLYPCISCIGLGVYIWTGDLFTLINGSSSYVESIDNMEWIGESLGEIKFK